MMEVELGVGMCWFFGVVGRYEVISINPHTLPNPNKALSNDIQFSY